MLLKVTSVDLLTRTLFVPKKQSHCPNACSGIVFSLEIDRTAEAPTAGECWLAAPQFGGQIIQIGYRCEFALNRNGAAWMTSWCYECIHGGADRGILENTQTRTHMHTQLLKFN